MKDTGHEFQGKQMELVGKWLRKESLDGLSIAPEQDKPPR
jgi:hypothetical protein